jgi:outer membrane receptor protein involved in Fe transport
MDLTFTHKHFGESLLTAGVDSQLVWFQTTSEVGGIQSKGNDATAQAASLFAEEKVVLGDFVVRAGGRYSYSRAGYSLIGGAVPEVGSKSWNVPLWSAGVRFNGLGPLSLYANAGSSFLAPSAKAVGGTLLASDRGVAGKNGQLPNTDLDPQSGIGTDLGADLWFGSNFRAGIRGFFNQVSKVIVDNVVSQDPSQTQSINAGSSSSLGAEASAEHLLNRYLQWFANVTWTTSRIENDVDPGQDGASIPFVPQVIANGGLTLRLPYQVSFSPYVSATGEYYDSSSKRDRKRFGPYAVLSMKAQKISLSAITR